MIRKRLFLGLLFVSWFQFIGRVGQIYFTANFPQVAMFAPTAETFRDFLKAQDFFVFVMTVYIGAGLIANDRRANALQIYLSKPLLRSEYIAGKAAVLFFFLMLITWVPGILLLIVQVMFAGNFDFLKKNLFLFPAITVASLLKSCWRPSPCSRCRRSRRVPGTFRFSIPGSSFSPLRSTASSTP